MRHIVLCLLAILCAVSPTAAVEFLGVDLCEGSVDTSVVLPVGSPLSLQSSEIGRYGGLLLLLTAENGDIMDHVDNLMSAYTGSRGTGDAKKLQWTGNQLTAYAQLIKKGYAALAVSTTDDCLAAETDPEAETGTAVDIPEPVPAPDHAVDVVAIESTETAAGEAAALAVETRAAEETEAAASAAIAVETEGEKAAPSPVPPADFELKGNLKHAAAEDGWVDVMGVVVNRAGTTYSVASFDLSLYDGVGDLICVDTISVNQLRGGQERAFRSAIRCPDYDAAAVASWKLQFAGAH